MNDDLEFLILSLVAGLLASLACGLGALPLLIPKLDMRRHVGLAYAYAGGLMIAASVYNLLMPAFATDTESATDLLPVVAVLSGLGLGCLLLWSLTRYLTPERMRTGLFRSIGGRTSILVFVSMAIHSVPEGVAVGVGYGSETHLGSGAIGATIALAIAIHNIPEGLAVALPMRVEGASVARCFLFAFLSSLPQPIASVPAGLMVWLFEPLVLPALGFAAGAMMYLVVVELIPDALETQPPTQTAWAFMAGFATMVLVQVVI